MVLDEEVYQMARLTVNHIKCTFSVCLMMTTTINRVRLLTTK